MTWDDEQEYSAMKSYHAFLIRCWCEKNAAVQDLFVWRFSVTQIGGVPQAPLGFSTFDALMQFLASEILGSPPSENPPPDQAADSPSKASE